MTVLSYDRSCAEIVAQTDLLRSCLGDADLTAGVPSCPGWNVGQLVRHLGGAQRWAETIVRTQATQPLPNAHFRDLSAYTNEEPAVLGPWLIEGAARLADALCDAGPQAQVWTPVPGGTTKFYARRFTHETLIHRADATLALSAEFIVDKDVALDAVDEWMELSSLPMHFEVHPQMRELLGPGRTLHFHATDTATCCWSSTSGAPPIAKASRSSATQVCSTSGWSGLASNDPRGNAPAGERWSGTVRRASGSESPIGRFAARTAAREIAPGA
jgi:uncharacterized protein (TIGR03083 family)